MDLIVASPKKGPAKPNNSPKGSFQENTSDINVRRAKDRAMNASRTLTMKVAGINIYDRAKMLANVRKGLSVNVVNILEVELDATQRDVIRVLSISPTTFKRRKAEGRLHTDESDRAIRYAQLKETALALMQGNNEAAIQWIHTPLEILGGETPLEHASTELGAKDVDNLIGRLRHGVIS